MELAQHRDCVSATKTTLELTVLNQSAVSANMEFAHHPESAHVFRCGKVTLAMFQSALSELMVLSAQAMETVFHLETANALHHGQDPHVTNPCALVVARLTASVFALVSASASLGGLEQVATPQCVITTVPIKDNAWPHKPVDVFKAILGLTAPREDVPAIVPTMEPAVRPLLATAMKAGQEQFVSIPFASTIALAMVNAPSLVYARAALGGQECTARFL